MTSRLITAALPYANGPLHFGHLAGVYIPADIFFRHSRLIEKDAVYICGSDEHGVAITLNAEKQKMPYQQYVDQWNKDHQDLFKSYNIEFSYFGRTTSKLHAQLAQDFFSKIHKAGYLVEKSEKQAYCLNDKTFLPDRYLTGVCTKCGYPEARSDECPNCGSWLSFDEIRDPKCSICGKGNIESREVKHWYFDLPKLAPQLREWLQKQTHWKSNVRNYALSLLESTPQRAVTRNVTWGIDLPPEFHADGKKIYVWFEAPVGYLSNLKEWAAQKGDADLWKKYWDPKSELIHFIGKDNIIFHTIIWPGMLLAAGERLPTNVPANMFVNLMKKQFSKSSGWYVDAREALQTYGVDRVRYYLTTIIPEVQDTNFDWQNFHDKVNAELVNKIANLFNRVGTQIKKHYDGILTPENFKTIKNLASAHSDVIALLEKYDINGALSRVVTLCEEANKYLDDVKPWSEVKVDKEKAKILFAVASNYMMSVAALLQPFVPAYADRLLTAFSIPQDEKLRATIYQSGAFEMLQGRGLKIQAESDFVIPRIDSKIIEEEIKKLGQLKG
ncbi:MAG: methionine--tRNA ligase [Deltaproteobacteria bacterium]|nr:methionine--tRNA ligase [Deltaproteobacteria bacterium]